MHYDIQAAVKVPEEHPVAAVTAEQGLGVVAPRPRDLSRHRLRDADGISILAEARPYHQQLAARSAVEEASVGNVAAGVVRRG